MVVELTNGDLTWWLYKGKPFDPTTTKGFYGFVYIILNVQNGREYIGRKYFTKSATKYVKKRKRRIRKPSGWEDYWGSCDELLDDIEKYGKDSFRRTIMKLCENRAQCAYYETKLIFETDALLKDTYYNYWVSCRIRKSNLRR